MTTETTIRDAAAAVKATAELATTMLLDLQRGWLWKLITRQSQSNARNAPTTPDTKQQVRTLYNQS